MSQDPWNDWSTAWRAAAPPPAYDIDTIERRVRRRLAWRRAQIVMDLAACALAIAVSVWTLTLDRPLAAIVGGAGLIFSLFGLTVALSGRRPSSLASRSMLAALDWEIVEIDADIRRSVGGLAIAGAGALFLAFCLTMAAIDHPLAPAQRWLALFGVGVIVGSALWSGWLLARRRARRRHLTALRAELGGDAG